MNLTGSCLCGNVNYRIDGNVRDVVNCYCSQCRKTSGHFVAATQVNKDDVTLITDSTLTWYECLPNIFRGFCNNCGGNLFWDNKNANDNSDNNVDDNSDNNVDDNVDNNVDDNVDDNKISIMAGTLDTPTKLKTIANIFTEDASDYCEIYQIEPSEQ